MAGVRGCSAQPHCVVLFLLCADTTSTRKHARARVHRCVERMATAHTLGVGAAKNMDACSMVLLCDDPGTYELQVEVTGFGVCFLNSLRRVLLAEVPCFAFHDIVERVNTSAVLSERIVDLLGLVPVMVPGVDMIEVEREYRMGDRRTKKAIGLRFSYHAACTSQRDFTARYTFRRATAASLRWMPRTFEQSSLAPNLRPSPVYDDMPITNLALGTSIDFEATCIPGTGAIHAKWSPVCTCFFRHNKATKRCLVRHTAAYGAEPAQATEILMPACESIRRVMHDGTSSLCGAPPLQYENIARDVPKGSEMGKHDSGGESDDGAEDDGVSEGDKAEDSECDGEGRLAANEDAVMFDTADDDDDELMLFSVETTGAMLPSEAVSYAIRILQTRLTALLHAFGVVDDDNDV